METTFSLSLASLSLEERTDAPYEPPPRSTCCWPRAGLRVAETWTLVTARTDRNPGG